MSHHIQGPWHWINSETDEPYDFYSKWNGRGYPSLRTVKEYGENKTEVRNGQHYSTCALPKFILDAEPFCMDPEVNEANARLIASAPELLSALERIAAYPETSHQELGIEAIKAIARVAIEKAEGGLE
ncbi:MAG: hypothetical protein ACRC8G_08990 [Plesiomonas shigelloides]